MAIDSRVPPAVVDIGTNTAVLLAPADAQRGHPRVELERFVRLGEELSSTGNIGNAALGRLRDALEAFRAVLDDRDVSSIRVVGTSACRDAGNVSDVASVVRETLGAELHVISGREEAELSFVAAKHALAADPAVNPAVNPAVATSASQTIVVVDIGGGSTEIVLGPATPTITGPDASISLDIGSVRCTERFVQTTSRPIKDDALESARAFIDAALGAIAPEITAAARQAERVVFVDGIATVLQTLCAANRDDGAPAPVLNVTELTTLFNRVRSLDINALIALAPDCLRGRADVLPVALLILLEVMQWCETTRCTLAETSVRDAVVCRMMGALPPGQ